MKIAPQLVGRKLVDSSPGGAGRAVRVHIEELLLYGFAPEHRHRIARAVEVELARLLREETVPRWQPSPPALERINGGAFRASVDTKVQETGSRIARAIFQGLRQHARTSARPGAQLRRP